MLTDYELIGQSLNDLDVIEKAKMQRAILVTSHYENQEIIQRAIHLKIKILPKMLASQIKLVATDKRSAISQSKKSICVDLVYLDDDKSLLEALNWFYQSKNKTLKTYHSADALLAEISLYPKDTKICTDYTLSPTVTGVEVTKILHKQGYTNLYLCTGNQLKQADLPSYLHLLKDKSSIMNF